MVARPGMEILRTVIIPLRITLAFLRRLILKVSVSGVSPLGPVVALFLANQALGIVEYKRWG